MTLPDGRADPGVAGAGLLAARTVGLLTPSGQV